MKRNRGLTYVTVHNDRPAHKTRPDPVVAKDGVFADIAQEQLRPEEAARTKTVSKRQETDAEASVLVKRWTPSAILERLTKLYGRFKNPKRAERNNARPD